MSSFSNLQYPSFFICPKNEFPKEEMEPNVSPTEDLWRFQMKTLSLGKIKKVKNIISKRKLYTVGKTGHPYRGIVWLTWLTYLT